MYEIKSLVFIFPIGITITIMASMSVQAMTPWQLFQSLCPYFSAQSPQCAMLQQQLQQQQASPTAGVPSTSPPSQAISPSTSAPSP
jgi:hypothetical protein